MKVYIPYYTGSWAVMSIKADRIRKSGNIVFINGQSYPKTHIFKTESSAWAYINKDYYIANRDLMEV